MDHSKKTELGRMIDKYGYVQYIAYEESRGELYVSIVVVEITGHDTNGPITTPQSFGGGPEEVAVLSVKADGCSHIGFRDPELSHNWVHVCGTQNMQDTLKMLAWAWNIAYECLKEKAYAEDFKPIKLDVC